MELEKIWSHPSTWFATVVDGAGQKATSDFQQPDLLYFLERDVHGHRKGPRRDLGHQR